MGSYSKDLDLPAHEAFSEIQQCIGASNYKVKTIVANQSVIAEGNRDFSWVIVIILIILIWPAALVYYFTRQRSSITATIAKTGEKGCSLTITSNGNSGDDILKLVKDVFEDKKSKLE